MEPTDKKSKRFSRALLGLKKKVLAHSRKGVAATEKISQTSQDASLPSEAAQVSYPQGKETNDESYASPSVPFTGPSAPVEYYKQQNGQQTGENAPHSSALGANALGGDAPLKSTTRVPYAQPDLGWKLKENEGGKKVGTNEDNASAIDGTADLAGNSATPDVASDTKTVSQKQSTTEDPPNAGGSDSDHQQEQGKAKPKPFTIVFKSRIEPSRTSDSGASQTKGFKPKVAKPKVAKPREPFKWKDPRDLDGPPPGAPTHTDSSGGTSYYSPPVRSNHTTPGYEWASQSNGYDWASRQALYGYDNPTMGEAYSREVQRRQEHVAHVHEKMQKLRDEPVAEKTKEPGIKMGYMYHA